jgi:hypothetical protein
MSTYLAAMAVGLAVRDRCKRAVEKERFIDNLNIDVIVAQAVRHVATCLPCPDDVFEGIAKAIQASTGCNRTEAFEEVLRLVDTTRPFAYSRWRHGGWYVAGIRYPSGACGCVSNNYPDSKWRIVCDDQREALNEPGDVTFPTREAAARAEQVLALEAWMALVHTPA